MVKQLFEPIRERYSALDRAHLCLNWHSLGDEWEHLSRAGQRMLEVPTLPGGLWRLPFKRFDLRLHRRIVLIDDQAFTESLRLLKQSYLDQSQLMDAEAWLRRPPLSRFTENLARLLSPLL